MVIIGVILAVVGLLLNAPILLWLGVALVVIGLILALAGGVGHPVGGRAHWF
jgi:uncharacterized membrane protein